jgi:hypothetical protein
VSSFRVKSAAVQTGFAAIADRVCAERSHAIVMRHKDARVAIISMADLEEFERLKGIYKTIRSRSLFT